MPNYMPLFPVMAGLALLGVGGAAPAAFGVALIIAGLVWKIRAP